MSVKDVVHALDSNLLTKEEATEYTKKFLDAALADEAQELKNEQGYYAKHYGGVAGAP